MGRFCIYSVRVRFSYVLFGLWILLPNARSASTTPAILNTNSAQTNAVSLARSHPRQAESTRRMIARLAEIRKSLDPIKLSFLSEQRTALLAPMIERTTNASEKINLR